MENNIVRIFTAQDLIQAQMILEMLANHDIAAYKQDLGSAGIMNVYGGNAKGGEAIYVAEANAEKAKKILKESKYI